MKNRKLLLASLIALGTVSLSANAGLNVNLDIVVAPPAPRIEPAPPPRVGFVWAPGYWGWEGHRHVWMQGHWIRERPGYAWVGERWVPHGDHYRLEPGHWERGPERHAYGHDRDDHPDHGRGRGRRD